MDTIKILTVIAILSALGIMATTIETGMLTQQADAKSCNFNNGNQLHCKILGFTFHFNFNKFFK